MADQDPAASNIETVARLQLENERKKSWFDHVIDAIHRWVSSAAFLIVHVLWFAVWIGLNVFATPFDPFPFSLLTLIVSLEAILLSGLLLMAQDRMTKEADRREELDLQVDLLAEQELTAILTLVRAVAQKQGIDVKALVPEIDPLQARTSVEKLASSLDRARPRDAEQSKSRD
jgi:uncharacterized membrane protein